VIGCKSQPVSNDLSRQQWHHQFDFTHAHWSFVSCLDYCICHIILIVFVCRQVCSPVLTIPVRTGVFYSPATDITVSKYGYITLSVLEYLLCSFLFPSPVGSDSPLCRCAQLANWNTDALCLEMEKLFHHISSPCLVQRFDFWFAWRQ